MLQCVAFRASAEVFILFFDQRLFGLVVGQSRRMADNPKSEINLQGLVKLPQVPAALQRHWSLPLSAKAHQQHFVQLHLFSPKNVQLSLKLIAYTPG